MVIPEKEEQQKCRVQQILDQQFYTGEGSHWLEKGLKLKRSYKIPIMNVTTMEK